MEFFLVEIFRSVARHFRTLGTCRTRLRIHINLLLTNTEPWCCLCLLTPPLRACPEMRYLGGQVMLAVFHERARFVLFWRLRDCEGGLFDMFPRPLQGSYINTITVTYRMYFWLALYQQVQSGC